MVEHVFKVARKALSKALEQICSFLTDMFTALDVESLYENDILEQCKNKKVTLYKEGWPSPYCGYIRSFVPNRQTGSYTLRLETDDVMPKIVYAVWWEIHIPTSDGEANSEVVILSWRQFGCPKPNYKVQDAPRTKSATHSLD